MKTSKKIIIAAILIFISFGSYAQNNWSIEIRPGVNFATQEIGGVDLKTGYGAEAALGYMFMPHLGAYAGWGWNKFKAESSFAGLGDVDFEVTGYTFGLQFIHPIATSNTSYLVRIGGIYNHIEVENRDGDIIADSGHGFGWELGAGLNFALGGNWNLRPQVGYRSLSRDIKAGNVTTEAKLNYITAGLGIA